MVLNVTHLLLRLHESVYVSVTDGHEVKGRYINKQSASRAHADSKREEVKFPCPLQSGPRLIAHSKENFTVSDASIPPCHQGGAPRGHNTRSRMRCGPLLL